jgi:putative endopeptidase
MLLKRAYLPALLLLILAACKSKTETTTVVKTDVLTVNLDSTVSPGQDIFLYANGGWIKNNPIPGDQSSWGIGNLVIEENRKRLREISEKADSSNAAKGSPEQKIGDFWKTAMDSAGIERTGLQPLQSYFDKINAISDPKSLISVSAELKRIGVNNLFGSVVGQDDKNSTMMAYFLSQGGLGLPEREYYFKTDSATMNIRKAYVKNIVHMLQLAGKDSADANRSATKLLVMETRLAKASRTREALEDPFANYNKMAIPELGKMGADVDWTSFLSVSGVKSVDSVIVGQPEFFTALNKEIKTFPVQDWKNYLLYRVLRTYSTALPDRFGIEMFEYNKLLYGAKQQLPRWKRVIQSEENAMGELLGQLYVKEFFTETAKKRYSDLVERIEKLTWMSDSTKQKAYAKLAVMKKKVGYPDKWKDFSTMEIGTDSYVQNLINVNSWWYNYRISKLGQPVNYDEWNMYPQTYNAQYDPSKNEIILPAGIFTVPGYRDEELDDAMVYGYAAASTIGHEITHGFDDYGRNYDAKGNLSKWWSINDSTEFAKRSDVMVRQFNEYEPLKGLHINGRVTLGENIADLGGLLLGLDAFRKTEAFNNNEKIAGLTSLQRYFLGYALGWMYKTREESLRTQIMTDEHAPEKYRVIGPFVNVDEFYTAFNIKPGDAMYRADSSRVRIW